MRLVPLVLVGLFSNLIDVALPEAYADAGSNDDVRLTRWAIVAGADVQKTGLSDLLTADLSAESVELVERDLIEKVLAEQELTRSFGAAGVGQRAKLGRLLSADVLLMLRRDEHNGRPSVRVVISDTTVGARLHTAQHDLEQEQLEQLSAAILADVGLVKKRFGSGVRQLVTVMPFLSRNLTHDFDYLQSGYASWLGLALNRLPGVAVTEVEEAWAIRRELDLAGGDIADVWRPLFVSGEFTMERGSESPTVRLQLRMTDSTENTETLESRQLDPSEVPEWLGGTVTQEIARRLEVPQDRIQPRAERDSQFQQLRTQAQRFADFRSWHEAIALSEAALLLKDDPEVQARLIHSYAELRLATHERHWQQYLQTVLSRADWKRRNELDIQQYRTLVSQGRRLLGMNPDPELRLPSFFDVTVRGVPFLRMFAEKTQSQEIARLRESYFWDAVSHFSHMSREEFRRLGPAPAASDRERLGTWRMAVVRATAQYNQWLFVALHYVFHTRGVLPGGVAVWTDNGTPAALERLLTDYTLRDVPASSVPQILLPSASSLRMHFEKARLHTDQLQELGSRMQAREEPLLQFYGRCFQLSADLIDLKASNPADVPAIRSQVQALLKLSSHWERETPHSFVAAIEARRAIMAVVRETSQPSPSVQPLRPTPRPATTVEPFEWFTIERLNVPADFLQLQHCRDDIDVVWSVDEVQLLRAGKPTPFFSAAERDDEVRQVAWDGELVWIGCRRTGVYVLELSGRQRMHFPRQSPDAGLSETLSLPPWELDGFTDRAVKGHHLVGLAANALRLHGVSPGRCLIVGRMASTHRVWIALAERQPGTEKWTLDLLHEATRQPDRNRTDGNDLDEACELTSIVQLPTTTAMPSPRFIIGRRIRFLPKVERAPLLIDVTTKEVTRYSGAALPHVHNRFSLPLTDAGRLFVSLRGQAAVLSPDGDVAHHWGHPELVPFDRDLLTRYETAHPPVVSDGTVYFPGRIWRRLSSDGRSISDVTPAPVSPAFQFGEVAVSGHFGLVGWNRGDNLYRIRVQPSTFGTADATGTRAESADSLPGPNDRYPFVPDDLRDRHAFAVQKLSSLGAVVHSHFGYPGRIRRYRRTNPQWRTRVWLGSNWSGEDRDLRLLEDLYQVSEIAFAEAPVSDAVVPIIAPLKLDVLAIERTRITDAGLEPLRKHPTLGELRLMSTGSVTDESLSIINSLQLERLMLAGSGFTNETLDRLAPRSSLRQLSLAETAISGERLSQLKKSRPRLEVSLDWRD